MKLHYNVESSHRWYTTFKNWIILFDEKKLPLDDIAFKSDIIPDLSGMKTAFLYFTGEAQIYHLQTELLTEALKIDPGEWEPEVSKIARLLIQDFISDVSNLVPSLGIDLNNVPLTFDTCLVNPTELDWKSTLHQLEEQAMTSPRNRATLAAWLGKCLHAKLMEELQSFRRAAFVYWVARRENGEEILRNVVGENIEAFGWRFSNFIHDNFVPEKVDPRTGKRISWPSTKTDHETRESHPLFGRKIAEQPLQSIGRVLKMLYDTVVSDKPIKATRRFYTCPRRDVFAKVGQYFAEELGYEPEENLFRVSCKFCFMHASTEVIRNVPSFFEVNSVENIPYHGNKSQCVFRWEFKLKPLGLIGLSKDQVRVEYVQESKETPPEIMYVDQIDHENSDVNIIHSIWDRSRFQQDD